MFKTWVAWTKATFAFLGLSGVSGLAGYSTALEKIPKPPDQPAFFDVCIWAIGFNDPAATIAAIFSILATLATLYQLFGPKPAGEKLVKKLFAELRKYLDASFKATHESADDRRDEVLAAIAGNELTRYDQTQSLITNLRPTIPQPFRLIANEQALFGSMKQQIVPTKDEYESGQVHQPELLKEVEEALCQGQGVLVSGHGSSGKTTLSVLLTHRPKFTESSCFYLDLASYADSPDIQTRITEAMQNFGNIQSLFVIDNAHLAPSAARDVVKYWQNATQGSKLLLLARQIRGRTKNWEVIPSLANIGLTELSLINTEAELEGAYRRLFHREYNRRAEPVDSTRLTQWMALFQGDLIAFSAAVLNRISDRHWNLQLDANDASAYVLAKYLNVNMRERDDLIALAAVYDREISLPVSCLAEAALSDAIGRGVVWIEARGIGDEWKSFRLVHPGIARLILRAASIEQGEASTKRIETLLAAPRYAGFAAIRILEKGGFPAEANKLCERIWLDDDWPVASLPLVFWRPALKECLEKHVQTSEALQIRAAEWIAKGEPAKIVELCTSTPLNSLTTFLRFAQQELPAAWTSIRATLESKDAITQLTQSVLASPLNYLAGSLRYAQDHMPAIWAEIKASLLLEEAIPNLAEKALSEPLDFLADFSRYAKNEMPEVSAKLSTILSSDSAIERLKDKCFSCPIGELVAFLRYAKISMPVLWEAVWESLWKEEHRASLINRIFDGELTKFVNFLNYISEIDSSHKLRKDIVAQLIDEKYAARLGKWLTSARPERLAALAEVEPQFELAIKELDGRECERLWAAVPIRQPDWFPKFSKLCSKIGRFDLAEIVALQILKNAQATEFSHPSVTIILLSRILLSARTRDENIQLEFLHRCISTDWLDQQFANNQTQLGTLAGAARSFAMHPSQKVRAYFARDALLARLIRHKPTAASNAPHVAIWLQLLGSTCLIFDETLQLVDSHVPNEKMSEALALFPAAISGDGIQFIQSGLWMGLHQWCFLKSTSYRVDARLAEGIWAAFIVAKPENNIRQERLNVAMVGWLSKGHETGWVLPIPDSSLKDYLDLDTE